MFSHFGTRAVCIREYQRTLQQSSKALVEATIRRLGLIGSFRILHDRIETPGGGVIMFAGMSDHTAECIKSLEGCRRAWIEEAQTLTERSLKLLTPTIREPDAEIWASWNPRHRTDAIQEFPRGNPPTTRSWCEQTIQTTPGFRRGPRKTGFTTKSTAERIIATCGKAITCRCSKAPTLPTVLQWRTRTAA